uniref:Uncharacterized protein n=1 Tax=Florenciella parvula TaxID=236787 RepID=A0A7S2B351_9STRA|mmetsp:Transcript_12542/g.26329  ORF Transcript_12542/g.26329 Transcript_12542/m.26329 type:complete len:157 (+) Transcript_12542:125-595(+)|eukprot:CAMPEP_0182525094 /NCGR_PEP_ID=MMETSP1323-20130603/2259_1 /TAXON_ID=236787 /ORGANISM="Florenciella parvula, Strain RCC1693" /LENGTH=156 /DNA_ID=CAMNT_0024733781 /DNA_START=119 /DNA_END=589 /DNA_ORIENTATION=+
MGKGRGKGSAGDATPYIVTHALGIVVSLLAIICSSIAYVELNKYQVYLGFIMGVAALALIYNISATVEDCKRFDIAWSRAHDRFFCADLVLLILVTPIAIAGASLWQNVADAEDDGSQGISAFRGSVILCWLIFLMTSVCGVQDYVAAQNDSGLLN